MIKRIAATRLLQQFYYTRHPFTVKEHALVVVVVILVRNLLLSVCVSLSQLLVDNLLNLWPERASETEVRIKSYSATSLTWCARLICDHPNRRWSVLCCKDSP